MYCIRKFPALIALLVLTIVTAFLSGCAGFSLDAAGFPERYRQEMTAMTQAHTATAVLVTTNQMSVDKAKAALAETDKLVANFRVGRLLRSPMPTPDMAALEAAELEARNTLAALLGVAARPSMPSMIVPAAAAASAGK